MNYYFALMGLILCAPINTFTMNDDTDEEQHITYTLSCSICDNPMDAQYTEIKTVMHAACMLGLAHSDYVNANPIVTSQPWLTLKAGTNTQDGNRKGQPRFKHRRKHKKQQ